MRDESVVVSVVVYDDEVELASGLDELSMRILLRRRGIDLSREVSVLHDPVRRATVYTQMRMAGT